MNVGRTRIVILAALAGLLLMGCGVVPSQAPAPSGRQTHRHGEAPTLTPARGALFGAFVAPPQYVETARIESFEGFERQLGRPLAIYHDYHKWAAPFPSASDDHFANAGADVLLSWAGTDTRLILSRRYDDMIRRRAEELARLGRPVLLRWRWEMNRPNLKEEIHSAADYIAAWRHIHDVFKQAGTYNVEWVWCPLTSSRADLDYRAYYPGDTYVDWICTDGYAEYPGQSFEQVFTPFLSWAATVGKPIMIGEFGRDAWAPGTRAAWLKAAQAYVKHTPQIKAVVYFENGAAAVADDADSLAALRAWAKDPYFDVHR